MDQVLRSEYKYLISSAGAALLKARLTACLRRDGHTGPGGFYHIRSLYFDDVDWTAYREKLAGAEDRRKLRLRYYDFDESFIVFEKKEKFGAMSKKTSARVTRDEAEAMMAGDAGRYGGNDSPLIAEFAALSAVLPMHPAVIVDYDRFAFQYPGPGNVRVTLDMALTTAPYRTEMFRAELPMVPVLDGGTGVLEVKFTGALPRFISELVSDVPKDGMALSKYCKCLQIIE